MEHFFHLQKCSFKHILIDNKFSKQAKNYTGLILYTAKNCPFICTIIILFILCMGKKYQKKKCGDTVSYLCFYYCVYHSKQIYISNQNVLEKQKTTCWQSKKKRRKRKVFLIIRIISIFLVFFSSYNLHVFSLDNDEDDDESPFFFSHFFSFFIHLFCMYVRTCTVLCMHNILMIIIIIIIKSRKKGQRKFYLVVY